MKKIVSFLLALTLLAGMLTGCGGGSNNTVDNTGKTEIKIAISKDITNLDPQNHNNFVSAYVTRHVYSNLITLDENGVFVGDLLESFEYTDDTKTALKCVLKEGIKFHNGEALTSEDVKFSFERLKTQMVAHLIKAVDSVEVIDDRNFIIHLNAPNNDLFGCLYHPGTAILCKSHVEALDAAGTSINEDTPIGSGPYKFVEWKSGSSITIEKNEEYFDSARAAQNEKLTFLVKPETSARTIALESGDVDMVIDLSTADVSKIEENENYAVNSTISTRIEFITFNTQKAPFDNALVRQALNYAINKEDVLTVAIDGQGEVLNNYISPSAKGYYDITSEYEYNPEKAKELLAQAGYDESNPLTFSLAVCDEANKKGATVVQANLDAIGVKMEVKSMDSGALYDDAKKGNLDACYIGWGSLADPGTTYDGIFYSTGASNYSHYNNPTVDALIDDARSNTDPSAVANDHQTVLQTLNDDAMWVPLYTKQYIIGYHKDLQGVHNSAIGLHNFYGLHY